MTVHSSKIITALCALFAKGPIFLCHCVAALNSLLGMTLLFALIFYKNSYISIVTKATSGWSKLLCCLNVCAVLVGILGSGLPRFDLVFPTIVVFLVINAASKALKDEEKMHELKIHKSVMTTDASKIHERGTTAENADGKSLLVSLPSSSLDADVQEILDTCLPNPSDHRVVRYLGQTARKSIHAIVPEAKVYSVALGNLSYNAAQDLKPEVEIVAMASPEVLTSRLAAFLLKAKQIESGQRSPQDLPTLHPDLLQKTATRLLSTRLEGMKYWRSSYSGPEPKVILLAPASPEICDYDVRVSFAVNNINSVRQMKLTSKADGKTRELIAFVTNWAKARGIAQTAKGHLHPYAFGVLVVNFLRQYQGDLSRKTLIEVFRNFVQFYWEFDCRNHAISVYFTARGERIHENADSVIWNLPYIQDPLAPSVNLAASMCAESVGRLKEEFQRATEIFAEGVTIKHLLTKWDVNLTARV